MAKKSRVPRPTKKYEYELFFGTHDASKNGVTSLPPYETLWLMRGIFSLKRR